MLLSALVALTLTVAAAAAGVEPTPVRPQFLGAHGALTGRSMPRAPAVSPLASSPASCSMCSGPGTRGTRPRAVAHGLYQRARAPAHPLKPALPAGPDRVRGADPATRWCCSPSTAGPVTRSRVPLRWVHTVTGALIWPPAAILAYRSGPAHVKAPKRSADSDGLNACRRYASRITGASSASSISARSSAR